MKIIQPLLIALILKYFNGSIELNEALVYASFIGVFAMIGGLLHHPYYFISGRYGLGAKLGLSGLIYRKVSYQTSIQVNSSDHLGVVCAESSWCLLIF